jgi:hypothetical protein
MLHVGKKLFNSETEYADSFYQAILSQDNPVVQDFLAKGAKIPDFLYMQATNHDHLNTLKYLLSLQPNKRSEALKLAVAQGAVQCLNYLAPAEETLDLEELKKITPRRNQEVIANILEETISSKLKSEKIATSQTSP